MNKFEIIVSKILSELGYGGAREIMSEENISLKLYKNENAAETQYYIISVCDEKYFKNVDFYDLQKEVYRGIKNLVDRDPAIDKNTSWLMGVESNDDSENIMSKILLVEENPYYFKKMICPYSSEEVSAFLKEINDCSTYIDYMQQEVGKVNRFEDFHDRKDKAYDFLSRLMIKLPVIVLQIKKEKELSILSDDLERDMREKGLEDIYNFLRENIDGKTSMIDDDINALHDLYYQEDMNNE